MTEATLQRWDPVSGLRARAFAFILVPVALLYAIVITLTRLPIVTNPGVAVAGFAMLVAAGTVVMVASDPLRAPYPRVAYLSALGLGLIATMLNAVAMWGGGAHHPREHWGPITLGILIAAHTTFRPPREIAANGAAAAACVGIVFAVDGSVQAYSVPYGPSIVIGMAPVMALTVFSSVFAHSMVLSLRRWHDVVAPAAQAIVDQRREGISRTVRQRQLTALNREVVPFLFALLEKGETTEADRERALQIADEVRRSLVESANRSWLDELVEHDLGLTAVDDPDRHAARMADAQRTALRAFLVAAQRHPGFYAPAFSIGIRSVGGRCRVELTLVVLGPEHFVRTQFAPYVAVMRMLFSDLDLDGEYPFRRLKFSYGH